MPESGSIGDAGAWDRTGDEPPSLRHPADRRVAALAAVGAVATDLAWHAGLPSVATAVLIAVSAAALLASGRLANPQARLLAASVPLFGVWFSLRASPWLLWPDLAAVAGLLALGATLAERGSLLDLTIPAGTVRVARTVGHAAGAPRFAAEAVRRTVPVGRAAPVIRRRWPELARGALLAVPVVVTLAALLASADAVFASMFRIDVEASPLLGHAVAVVLGFLLVAGILRAASTESPPAVRSPRRRLGPVEVGIILGSIATLFGIFAAAQLVALTEGGRRVIETAGLTYAQYARSGFFQLVAVAVLTLAVVLGVRALADLQHAGTRRMFVALGGACVALTLVVVVVSVVRMNLYEQAYGLTMLRLYVKTFSLWIGVVFVLTGLWILGLGGSRHWVPSAALIAGLAGLLVLNIVNPEAIVVHRNLANAERIGRFDAAYATGLSTDAVPSLLGGLERLDATTRGQVLTRVCGSPPPPVDGWTSWNWSQRAAAEVVARACSPAGG